MQRLVTFCLWRGNSSRPRGDSLTEHSSASLAHLLRAWIDWTWGDGRLGATHMKDKEFFFIYSHSLLRVESNVYHRGQQKVTGEEKKWKKKKTSFSELLRRKKRKIEPKLKRLLDEEVFMWNTLNSTQLFVLLLHLAFFSPFVVLLCNI